MNLVFITILMLLPSFASAQNSAAIAKFDNDSLALKGFEFSNDGSLLVEVLPTAVLKTTQMRQNDGVSVRRAKDLPAFDSWTRREMVLINGGLSGISSDRPDGLLVSDGNAAALANRQKLRGQPDSDCALRQQDRLRLAGLLCVAQDGRLSIGKFDPDKVSSGTSAQDKAGGCRHALQSGPLLVEDGRAAVCRRKPDEPAENRSAVCIVGDKVWLVVTTKPAQLDDLAMWLAGEPNKPRCQWALALGGGDAAGAVYTPRNVHQAGKKSTYFGLGALPVASFIVVRGRP